MVHEARRPNLPVLDNVHIAAPCKASWADMAGDDHARFCGQCEKNVYNLSAMTRAEAEALLVEKEGKLCVRYYQRADGTILTVDCPDGVRRRNRKRRLVAVTFGAMSAMAAVASTFTRAPIVMQGEPVIVPSVQAPDSSPPLMGAIAPPPIPVMGKIAPPEDRNVKMGQPIQRNVKMGHVSRPPALMGRISVAKLPADPAR